MDLLNDLLLISKIGKLKYIVKKNNDFSCHKGHIKKDDLIEENIGKIIKTNKDFEFYLLKPNFNDYLEKIKIGAQVINFKELGAILLNSGINKDSICFDCGSGSGMTSIFLAKFSKKVYSIDIRKDHIENAKNNVNFMNIKNIEFINKDIKELDIDKKCDFFNLDVAEPWNAINTINNHLKIGGILISYSPSITQSQKLTINLENFIIIKNIEIIERKWVLDERRARPSHHGISHTGFLTIARKVI
jgi:tRNA (adenine57-N1/adenine58-N1)-methyltransferase